MKYQERPESSTPGEKASAGPESLRDETSVDVLLAEARDILSASPAETSPREARTLLSHILEVDESRLLARGERLVPSAEAELFRRMVHRRARGEPLAYVVGWRGFYGRDFQVDQRVLIPRPETEHLIEAALALELPAAPRIVDIGAGSGAIAVTLACELPSAEVVATDIDPGALEVARANARQHEVEHRVSFVRGDVAAPLDLSGVDLLVSNPPYISIDTEEISFEVHDFEPHVALFAPDQGREIVRRLMAAAVSLRPGVHLMIEIGFDQGDWLRGEAANGQHLELVELIRDYGGHERIAVLRRRE